MALMRGVKLGASGSKVRVFSAETNVPPFCSASYTVSVWSPLVTMILFPSTRTGA